MAAGGAEVLEPTAPPPPLPAPPSTLANMCNEWGTSLLKFGWWGRSLAEWGVAGGGARSALVSRVGASC